MHLQRKILCFFLVLCLIFPAMLPAQAVQTEQPVSEYRWITNRDEVDGFDYTTSDALAQKLDEIFDGNAGVYSDNKCTKMVNTKLGSYRVPNNGVNKYVGCSGENAENVGTSCWIYANGVYHTLFGEATGCGTPEENSEKLNLKVTRNANATYENFTAWGVHPGVGALIRTKDGHSMIVLGYDEERLTVLDGNGDGKGLISIRVRTWDRTYFSVKYIIQPTQDHLDQLYPETEPAEKPAAMMAADNTGKILQF